MHLLYVDESGSAADPNHKHFVLAGVSVFERATHWIEQELNKIAATFDAVTPHSLELHGSPMRAGRDGWKRFPLQARIDAIKEALKVGIVNQSEDSVRLFAVVVEKALVAGQDPALYAFERLTSNFDNFLARRYRRHGDAQRGIMVFDKSGTERTIQTLAREFKYNGHSWGKTHNYAEVPVFMDSQASRLIQLADLFAYSVFRNFEYGDSQFYDIFKHRFDTDGGVVHGLVQAPSVVVISAMTDIAVAAGATAQITAAPVAPPLADAGSSS